MLWIKQHGGGEQPSIIDLLNIGQCIFFSSQPFCRKYWPSSFLLVLSSTKKSKHRLCLGQFYSRTFRPPTRGVLLISAVKPPFLCMVDRPLTAVHLAYISKEFFPLVQRSPIASTTLTNCWRCGFMTFDRWHLVEITDCFSSNFLLTYHQASALFWTSTLHSSGIGLVLSYKVFQKAYYYMAVGGW